MRIAEYKKISENIEQRVIHHDAICDDAGNSIENEWNETVAVPVPVMGLVYRDATPEEVAEMECHTSCIPEPTVEEQLADLSDYVDVLTEMVLGGANDGH